MQLEAISSHPVLCYLGEETGTHLATTSFQVVVESDKVSFEPPFLQATQPQLAQPFHIRLLLYPSLAFLDSSALQDCIPRDSVNQFSKQAKGCPPEVQGSSSVHPPPYSSENRKLHTTPPTSPSPFTNNKSNGASSLVG